MPLFSLPEADATSPTPTQALSALSILSTLGSLSISHFKSWGKCPQQFYFKQVLRSQWLSDERNFELGKSVHKLLDYQARKLPLEALLQATSPTIRNSYGALAQHPLAQAPVVANEWAFNVPLTLGEEGEVAATTTTVWLHGRVDRIVAPPQALLEGEPTLAGTKLWVLDWKTGTAIPKLPAEDWQTRLYLFAVFEARAQLGYEALPPEGLAMVYAESKPKQRPAVRLVSLPYNAAWHEENRRILSQQAQAMLRAIGTASYPLPPTCPDTYCPYGPVCGIAPATGAQLNLLKPTWPTAPVLANHSVLPQAGSVEEHPEAWF